MFCVWTGLDILISCEALSNWQPSVLILFWCCWLGCVFWHTVLPWLSVTSDMEWFYTINNNLRKGHHITSTAQSSALQLNKGIRSHRYLPSTTPAFFPSVRRTSRSWGGAASSFFSFPLLFARYILVLILDFSASYLYAIVLLFCALDTCIIVTGVPPPGLSQMRFWKNIWLASGSKHLWPI